MLRKNGGFIIITDDPLFIKNAVACSNDPLLKILSLDESTQEFDPSQPNIIQSTCLLPPPEALIAEIDGKKQEFVEMYNLYLSSDVVLDFISIIISSIYIGYHLMIYAPGSSDSIWASVLIDYIMMNYGIMIGTPTIPWQYNNNFNNIISELLYALNILNASEFIYYYSPSPWKPLSPSIIFKLSNDLKLPIDVNNVMNVINSIKSSMLNTGNNSVPEMAIRSGKSDE